MGSGYGFNLDLLPSHSKLIHVSYSLRFKIKFMFKKIRGLKVIFCTFSTKLRVLQSSH